MIKTASNYANRFTELKFILHLYQTLNDEKDQHITYYYRHSGNYLLPLFFPPITECSRFWYHERKSAWHKITAMANIRRYPDHFCWYLLLFHRCWRRKESQKIIKKTSCLHKRDITNRLYPFLFVVIKNLLLMPYQVTYYKCQHDESPPYILQHLHPLYLFLKISPLWFGG